ncbi:vesicle-associated membrane protein-associated protein A [Drosophila teissieri]|uniref:vesicle-associated membrane protein-associated protein A n=1 Tax=Drosophila teissieri TaxID=7243 RepID=UPI001CB9F35F|nr:vesicle-associated membrane protein-associated protein A [Drosophila teissieri]
MSNNTESKLLLDPCDGIVFDGPFSRSVSRKLVISNTSKTQRMAFKMKTTTPKLFYVRPNIGVLGPEEKVTIDIFMQPILQEQIQKRHKFLLLAAEATGDITDMQEFWKLQRPEDIWDTKIKCELIPSKEEEFRQAGGSARSSTDNKDGEVHFDAQEVSEPVAKLLKQISMLEDERLALKDQIDNLRDQTIETNPGQAMMRPRRGRINFFFMAAIILTILGALLGAFYGKNYL